MSYTLTSMRILGIDPGLATIGIGVVETENYVDFLAIEWLTIVTEAKKDLAERLVEIRKDLHEYVVQAKPDLCVVEKLFFTSNVKTGIDVSHARGVIMETIGSMGIPLIEVTPSELKSGITGDGKADKKQIQEMLLHILKLEETPKPDDAADALALAIFGGLHPQECHIC